MNSKQQQRHEHEEDDSPTANKRVRSDGVRRVARRFPEPENAARTTTVPEPRSRQGGEFRAMAISDEMKGGVRLSVEETTTEQRQQQQQKQHYPQQQEQEQQNRQHNYQQQREKLGLSSRNDEPLPSGLWDPSRIEVQSLPAFFPRNMLQWERFPLEDLPTVLERISAKLSTSSGEDGEELCVVQASPTDDPLSAKITARRGEIELYLVFFREKNDDCGEVSMSVQRTKGDDMVANVYIRRLVDIAKGIDEEGDNAVPADDNDFLGIMDLGDTALIKFHDAYKRHDRCSPLLQDESSQLWQALCQ